MQRHRRTERGARNGDVSAIVSDEMCEYEQARQERMAQNKAMLDTLGIENSIAGVASMQHKTAAHQQKKKKRQNTNVEVQRRSSRAKGITPTAEESISNVEGAAPASVQKEDEGEKLPDGTWRGERYGEVSDVVVGQVFGAGDYQREGRFEMSRNGFFVPKVQPEWLEPGKGCYSIILNNDNGLSQDHGDTIVYAGGGGRHRGLAEPFSTSVLSPVLGQPDQRSLAPQPYLSTTSARHPRPQINRTAQHLSIWWRL